MKTLIPSATEIGREAIIVIGGALLAAMIVAQFPQIKDWIRAQWLDTPR